MCPSANHFQPYVLIDTPPPLLRRDVMYSPGRFFAASELKAMLAHVVMTYDIKFEDGKPKPANVYIGAACIPGKGEIMFRKRQTWICLSPQRGHAYKIFNWPRWLPDALPFILENIWVEVKVAGTPPFPHVEFPLRIWIGIIKTSSSLKAFSNALDFRLDCSAALLMYGITVHVFLI